MSAHKENRSALLAAVLARALPDAQPYHIERAIMAMQHAAAAHKRHAENVCSYPMTDGQVRRAEKRCDRLASIAADALMQCDLDHLAPWTGAHGFKLLPGDRVLRLRFGGDPRSPCGWLQISDMPGDGWFSADGWAIYR